MGNKKRKQLQQPESARGASFFKVMIGDFKRCLAVPPSFTRYMKARHMFILKSHVNGKSWHVEAKMFAKNVLFQNGWGKFVGDNAIGLGEFLVFMYDGESGFDVDVYGVNGCKKESVDGDNSLELSWEKADADEGIHPLECLSTNRRKDVIVFGRKKSGPIRIGRRSRISFQRGRELEAALPFKPNNPYFVAIWRTTRANYMTIPRALAKEYKFGQKKNTTLLRDHLGRSWLVKIVTRGDGRIDITEGWAEFSRGNFLTEGDTCVFEFTKAGNIVQTHVLKVERRTGKLVNKYGLPVPRSREDMNNGKSVIPCLKERVAQVTDPSGSYHSHFFASWRWSQLHHVKIPRYLVNEHNLRVKKSVTLVDPCGRTWPVNIHGRADGSVDLGVGWEGFCTGNSLRDGDTCMFEFARGGDFAKVQILRFSNAIIKQEED